MFIHPDCHFTPGVSEEVRCGGPSGALSGEMVLSGVFTEGDWAPRVHGH